MNNQELIQEYLRKLEEEKALKSGNSYDKLRGYTLNANRYGNNFTTAGNLLKDNVNNEFVRKLGTSMSNLGGNISNGATSISNTLNKPINYFKGFADRTVGQGLSKIGSSLADNSGAIGNIGQSLSNLGSSITGTGAATTAGTAAGASTASTAGAGTAASSSAANGAMAANPIGILATLGVMALKGTNRKRAKQGGQELMNQTNQIVNQEAENALAQNQQNTADLQIQSQQALNNGIVTGGAAQIEDADGNLSQFPTTKDAFAASLRNNGWDDRTINSALNGYNLGNKDMANYIDEYNKSAAEGQQIIKPQPQNLLQTVAQTQTGGITQTENVKESILDKFLNGITDFSRGYQENKNNAFKPENLRAKTFTETINQPSEQLVNYQNSLRQQGIDENIINAVAQGKNSGNKDIANWISNNQEALNPTQTKQIDKNKMGRLGEAMGTIARAASKPAVQALVAGGLSTALTGNPLYGLGQAYKFGNNRANTNLYQEALKKQGIDVDTGMFGSLGGSEFKALMTPQYKQVANELLKERLEMDKTYKEMLIQDKIQKTANDKAYKEQKLVIDNKRAENAGKKGGGSGRKTTTKVTDHPDWNSDLAGFTSIMTNPKYVARADEAKARFIKKYGVDPMKYIKL